jgi:hypothetical protein
MDRMFHAMPTLLVAAFIVCGAAYLWGWAS